MGTTPPSSQLNATVPQLLADLEAAQSVLRRHEEELLSAIASDSDQVHSTKLMVAAQSELVMGILEKLLHALRPGESPASRRGENPRLMLSREWFAVKRAGWQLRRSGRQ